MNLSALGNRIAGPAELYLKKNAPTLLTAAGVAGFGVTTYLVGRAVLRSQHVIRDLQKDSDKILSKPLSDEYTKNQKGKELGELYVRRGVILLRIYGPAIVTGGVSIFCVLAAHGIMKRNQAALLAAYSALDTSYRAYRKRVQQEVGEEREMQLFRSPTMVESVDEEGEACLINDPNDDVMPSIYARFFDELSPHWRKNPEYNLCFLRAQQDYANDRLRIRGHLFLNEVLDALGLPVCQIGQVVGWRKDAAETGKGDGFVDFGIYDIADECKRAFVNGVEHTTLLDFNVDGPITI